MGKTIQTAFGKVSGILRDGCEEYLGVPYARPPVGELAFRHPVPPEPWEGVLRAEHPPKNPIQSTGGFSLPDNSEDCLYLNVFRPADADGKLPVMVWIYGGSYSCGGIGRRREDSEAMMYDLGVFARETRTCVVSVNYRLNVYGFLDLNGLSGRFDSGNGLWDLKLALEFVRDNIAAFGGDPENVTVFGQSAGGALALALMTAEKTKHLFHKVIAQSANAEHFWTREEGKRLAVRYLKLLGIPADRPERLLDVPHGRIVEANRRFERRLLMRGELACAFSPVLDGDFLTEHPMRRIAESGKPLLIGCARAETDFFAVRMKRAVLCLFPFATGIRPAAGPGTYRQRVSDALTDVIYKKPIREIAAVYRGPLMVYSFDFATKECVARGLRPCHASDLPVLFGLSMENICDAADPAVQAVGGRMRKLWGGFAWAGPDDAPPHGRDDVIVIREA